MLEKCRLALVAAGALFATACGGVGPRAAFAMPATPVTATARLGPDSIRLMGDGGEVARRLVAAVAGARRTVHAEIYEFDRPDLVQAMVEARRRGVAVDVVMDPTVTLDTPTAARLEAAGVDVHLFPDGQMQIDHVKLLVVDGAVAFFGGMNWGAHSYLNHDFELELRGPHTACLEAVFAADLARAGGDGRPATAECAWAGARIATTFPYPAIQPEVLRAVDAATHDAFLEMYVLTDPGAIAALVRAAARGVSVRVLLDPGQPQNRRALQQLEAGGVVARFYRSSGEKLHAKAMVVDGHLLVVGSANWSRSGFTRNHELDAVLDAPPLAAAALARMELDWRTSAAAA